jgi:nucleoside-diphosphate-sugar epimerase
MRILVIGGTHFIGLAAVRLLSKQGHDIAIFHRGLTEPDLPSSIQHIHAETKQSSTGFSPVHFTSEAIAAFRSFAPDVVLHVLLFSEQDAREAVDTLKGMARRMVVISSQDVYRAFGRVNRIEGGSPEPLPITEDSPLRERRYPYRADPPRSPDDPEQWKDLYDKILVEQVVMSEPALPGTILRLPAVYGPGDYQHRHFALLKRMNDRRPVILLDEAEAQWRWTYGYIGDVANAIALAVTDERASGRIYNVGEEVTLSLEERVRLVGQLAGWQGRIVLAPKGSLPEALTWGINPEQDIVVDSTRIRTQLGYKESLPLTEAMRLTVEWEQANPPAKIDPKDFDYAAEDAFLAEGGNLAHS